MISYKRTAISLIMMILLFAVTGWPHCDTMDGPVIKAAQRALEVKDVNLVLVWVQPKDDALIREVFDRTLKMRQLSPEAKELSDMYFFETLVRVHRAGEGAPYTGIKPSGSDVDPGVEMADEAVDSGRPDELLKHILTALEKRITASFKEVKELENYPKGDIEAGRKYVGAYVKFIHYVESVHSAVAAYSGEHQHSSDVHEH